MLVTWLQWTKGPIKQVRRLNTNFYSRYSQRSARTVIELDTNITVEIEFIFTND